MFTFVHVYKVARHTANSELGSKFCPYMCSSMVFVKLWSTPWLLWSMFIPLFSKSCDFSSSWITWTQFKTSYTISV